MKLDDQQKTLQDWESNKQSGKKLKGSVFE